MIRRLACLVAALAATACGGGGSSKPCDPVAQTGCASNQFCETKQAATAGAPSTTACFAPVVISGTVTDPTTSPVTLLNDARVVALDSNHAPVSTVAVSAGVGAAAGSYQIAVRAARDSTGKPLQANVTLRADRQGNEPFPGGVRTALPIDLSTATNSTGTWVVSGPLTALQLLPIGVGAGQSFIQGSVSGLPSGAGALVVAEPVGGGSGLTGIADSSGAYSIYNLQQGAQYVVTAYTKGMNYAPVTTPALATGVNNVAALQPAAGTGATVAGGLTLINGAAAPFQATLVLQSTYNSNLDRGETPPGLTVSADSSGYSFAGVPDGKYVVLAPFGDYGDIRLLSGTGNTAAPFVTVSGGVLQTAPASFKIAPAVDLVSIGGTSVSATPVVLSAASPVFVWQKANVDASAATYRVTVYDAFGNVAWGPIDQAAVSGTNTITYKGPSQSGMAYQLRIVAIKEAITVPASYTPLSQTEDLRGVFLFQ
ncbi:MAG TPA: hypothetical protein VFE30_13785 [Anaeromyxobacteraceae bacterium]|jgi:hypothetical protein|nr:hypothetical protein [Anaeromyxobacteraceae bacterium]